MRAINKAILERVAVLKQGVKIGGVPVTTIATDTALANLLGVSRQTVLSWRKNEVIPCKMVQGVARYKLDDVLAALESYSERDWKYIEVMQAVTKELDKAELYEKIKMLEARMDALSKQLKNTDDQV
jgi:DNA-binding transcriptional MerR regulator